jgi:Gpi18-like mannosyltransferase
VWPRIVIATARRLGSMLSAAVNDRAVRQAVAIVVGLRVALGLVGWASLQLLPSRPPEGAWISLILPDSDPFAPLVQPWQRWDGLIYQHIATGGYQGNSLDPAFFPLYPLVVHIVGVALGGAYALSALLVSTVALTVALVLLHRLISADLDVPTGDRTILYIALGPTAFFFLAPFSESLFLALSVGSFLAARRRRWAVAAGLAGLAAVCRPVGVLLVIPLLVEAVGDARSRRAHGQTLPVARYLAILTPVAVAIAYVATAGHVLGASPLQAEAHWGEHFVPIWSAVHDNFLAVKSDTYASRLEGVINLVAASAVLFALTQMPLRLPHSYVAYTAAMLLPLGFHEALLRPLPSAGRYAIIVFPLFALLARAGRYQWVDRTILVTFPVVMTMLFILYTHYHFVG